MHPRRSRPSLQNETSLDVTAPAMRNRGRMLFKMLTLERDRLAAMLDDRHDPAGAWLQDHDLIAHDDVFALRQTGQDALNIVRAIVQGRHGSRNGRADADTELHIGQRL